MRTGEQPISALFTLGDGQRAGGLPTNQGVSWKWRRDGGEVKKLKAMWLTSTLPVQNRLVSVCGVYVCMHHLVVKNSFKII